MRVHFPRRAMILAAGYGSRLGTIGQLRPKPLLPLCGAPLIVWTVRWLVSQGVREIVVNLHHLGEQIRQVLGDGSVWGASITYSEESTILGTGGGLRQARPLLDDGSGRPILVVNGKLIHEVELDQVVAWHERVGAQATMVVREDAEGIWGEPLGRRDDGLLAHFRGEVASFVKPNDALGLRTMFCGIHLLEPAFLDRIPVDEAAPCIVKSAYTTLQRETKPGQKGGLSTYLHRGYWWEHSTPERYLQGVQNVLAGALQRREQVDGPGPMIDPQAEVDGGAVVDPRVYLGPGTQIAAGARLGPGVALEANARVGPQGDLECCVVWPGVQVNGLAREAVLT